MDNFVTFQMPDGRLAFMRRDAVTVVFDNLQMIPGQPQFCTVHTATTVMPIPYTAEQAMEILYGG